MQPHLVPVAVVLGGVAVVLQHLGDGALVDALEAQLPLAQLQETPGGEHHTHQWRGGDTGRERERETLGGNHGYVTREKRERERERHLYQHVSKGCGFPVEVRGVEEQQRRGCEERGRLLVDCEDT